MRTTSRALYGLSLALCATAGLTHAGHMRPPWAEARHPLAGFHSGAVARHGPLAVDGVQLVDAAGEAVQLRGLSLGGIGDADYTPEWTIPSLIERFGIELVAVPIALGGGAAPDADALAEVIEECRRSGVYVLVDLRLTGPEPEARAAALTLLTSRARHEAARPNLIYALGSASKEWGWAELKTTAEAVIPAVRSEAPDALFVVESPPGAGRADTPTSAPIALEGALVGLRYTAGAQPQLTAMAQVDELISAGLPVFVTDWSASAPRARDADMGGRWARLLRSRGVSWALSAPLAGALPGSLLAVEAPVSGPWEVGELSEAGQHAQAWLTPAPPPAPATPLPELSVRGPQIVDPSGAPVVLRGVAVVDPMMQLLEGRWDEGLFDRLASWNVRLVRIAILPESWRRYGPAACLRLIDQAVAWASARGIYLMLDWHSMGNLKTGIFQEPKYVTTLAETTDFWRRVSMRYADDPTLAFYELFNEPTTSYGRFGDLSWEEWTNLVVGLIAEVRRHDPHTIPVVAGLDWAYDLTPLRDAPLPVEGVAYAVHPYPQKDEDSRGETREQKWEKTWGFAALRYPVIATEFSFMAETDEGAHLPCIGDEDFGRRLDAYLSARGISWTAWAFDPSWRPSLLDRELRPRRGAGVFYHDLLARK